MKLVLCIYYSDGYSYSSESFIVFEDNSVEDAQVRLLEVEEKNSFIDAEYWKDNEKYSKELDKFVKTKGYDKGVPHPIRPELKLLKFCGLEIVERRDPDTTYEIITLDEWAKRHTYNEYLEG